MLRHDETLEAFEIASHARHILNTLPVLSLERHEMCGCSVLSEYILRFTYKTYAKWLLCSTRFFLRAKNLVLHSSHFALNWHCCTALDERSSGGIWKFRTSSFKCYVDHSHSMYSSGNIDARNWVRLFESRCILPLCVVVEAISCKPMWLLLSPGPYVAHFHTFRSACSLGDGIRFATVRVISKQLLSLQCQYFKIRV